MESGSRRNSIAFGQRNAILDTNSVVHVQINFSAVGYTEDVASFIDTHNWYLLLQKIRLYWDHLQIPLHEYA